MKTALLVLILSSVLLPIKASAQYQYYFSDSFTNGINTSNWYKNGDGSATSGLTSTGSVNLISKPAITPSSMTSYEVGMQLRLTQSGGYYAALLRASSDAVLSSYNTGSYYAVEVANPTFSNGICTSASLYVWKVIAGSPAALASTAIPCHTGMVVRAVMHPAGYIITYVDNVPYLWPNDTQITSGAPGVTVAFAPTANSISQVQLGAIDTTPPNAINSQTVGVSAFPNRVDLQWQGVSDNPNGIGLYAYQIYRHDSNHPTDVWIASDFAPSFSDATVSSSITYTYTLQAVDWHWNTASTVITVVTPPAGYIDARQVGVRPTGSYWGGGGENIDMRSGNLNFSIPLLKVNGRGWTVPFNLSYNSQNWRKDPGGTWNLGRDSGFGYGWKLQAGALVPVYTGWYTIHHYLYIDATGAEYRLDQNHNGIWTSLEGIYVEYDSNAGRLYFPDGTFWVLGSTSAGTEEDAGYEYPTMIQDANGNQVSIAYQTGQNAPSGTSSGRMTLITDVNVNGTYTFTYSGAGSPPLLQSITSSTYPSANYAFSYSVVMGLQSPFDATQFPSEALLQSVANAASQTTTFTYGTNNSGELSQVTFPYGGHLRWAYNSITYWSVRKQREVQTRYLAMSSGANELTYTIAPTPADLSSSFTHSWTTVDDADGKGEKVWYFQTVCCQASFGLQIGYDENDRTLSPQTKRHLDSYWSLDTLTRPYLSTSYVTLDPGSSNQVISRTDQLLDQYGNVTSMSLYDFGAGGPTRVYSNTYLSGTAYNSAHIRNRLLTSQVSQNGHATTLVSNSYDENLSGGDCSDPNNNSIGLQNQSSIGMLDASVATNQYRGNVTTSVGLAVTKTMCYTISGTVWRAYQGTGAFKHRVSTSWDSTKGYAAPAAMTTTNGTTTLQQTFTWMTDLQLASQTGSNTDTFSVTPDPAGRPWTTTSPNLAVTTYTYSVSPAFTKASTNATNGPHWTKNTLDGFGRTITASSGYTANGTDTTWSSVDTVYAACACSPLGKISKVSQPYSGASATAWTTYTYDGLGRTHQVTAADGSITTYSYSGNTVTVTDAAAHWKTFTSDAFGNLTLVHEPNPDYDPNNPGYAPQYLDSTYTYDALNHLTQVSMTRTLPGPGNQPVTQTRTFNYTDPNTNAPGAYLRSANNPENGAITYTYNSDGTVASKTDAKNQKVMYTYDWAGRPIQIDRYPAGANTPDPCQGVSLYWDVLGVTGEGTTYPLGRLGWTATGSSTCTNGLVEEGFNYDKPGDVVVKAVQVTRNSFSGTLIGNFYYDNEGKPTDVYLPYPSSLYGPNAQQHIQYSYDAMSRPLGLTGYTASLQTFNIVSNAVYGVANELQQVSYYNPSNGGTVTENRTYNSRFQLTEINMPGVMDMVYTYPTAGANNGRIAKQKDNVSGEEVSFQYDALNRLIAATTTDASWGLAFSYDGFGNRLNQTITKGTALPMYLSVDMTTNRISTAGYSYDANGNLTATPAPGGLAMTYDVENRLQSVGGASYSYALDNKRIVNWASNTVYFYTPDGRKANSYTMSGVNTFYSGAFNFYFAGKLVQSNGQLVVTDRLGSVRANLSTTERFRYFPYGEEDANPTTANDREKFATYTRDSATGLDYADQRYYSSTLGRFTIPDRYRPSADPKAPQSWNRFAYVQGDPINSNDPTGLIEPAPDPGCDPEDPDPFCDPEPDPRPPPQEPSLPDLPCEIDVYERPLKGTGADHTYIYILDPNLDIDYILEGAPGRHPKILNPFGGNWGTLNGRIDGSGLDATNPQPLKGDNPSTDDRFARVFGRETVCGEVDRLLADVESYIAGPKVPYRPIPTAGSGTYNSNSFTYTLLVDIGLILSSTPSWTPGWGLIVPGL